MCLVCIYYLPLGSKIADLKIQGRTPGTENMYGQLGFPD